MNLFKFELQKGCYKIDMRSGLLISKVCIKYKVDSKFLWLRTIKILSIYNFEYLGKKKKLLSFWIESEIKKL